MGARLALPPSPSDGKSLEPIPIAAPYKCRENTISEAGNNVHCHCNWVGTPVQEPT